MLRERFIVKIAIVAPVNPFVPCGATYNTMGLKAGLESLGHEVHLIGFRMVIGEKKREKPDPGIRNAYQVPYYNIVPRRFYSLRDIFDRRWQKAATKKLLEITAREKIDLVCVRYAYYPHFTLDGIKGAFGGKTAVLSHPIFTAHLSVYKISKRLSDEIHAQEKKSLEECDTVLSYSPMSADIIVRDYGIPRDKISYTIAGVDTERFRVKGDKRAEKGWDRKFVIGYMGSLAAWQGLDYLIRAMPAIVKHNPNAFLAVFGPASDAAYARTLESLVSSTGMGDHVKFYGAVPHADVPLYLNSFDVFAAPYVMNKMQSTIFPIKCAEALVAGCRIVTTDQPGLSWIIKDGQNGMLARTDSAESLSEKIISVMDDTALASRISDGARKTGERFDWKRIARELVDSVFGTGREMPPAGD